MITPYSNLYIVLDRMSEKLKCGSCGSCENDLIYLLPDEVPIFKDIGIDLIEVEGVHFLVKNSGDNQYCPFRDQEKCQCRIYNNRPAICRMFPLEIKETDKGIWWGLCLYCPKVQNNEGNFCELLIQHIPEIEHCLNEDLQSFMIHADRICRRLELICGVPTKAALIRPVDTNGFISDFVEYCDADSQASIGAYSGEKASRTDAKAATIPGEQSGQ
jgi:Fe-S-cluster containining protein